jgi:CheY-like chemotaxis protein
MIDSPKALVAALKGTFGARPTPETLHVLVVDDEEPIRIYVNRVLRKAGHHTKVAGDAAEALRLARTFGPFDVLVTDLVMPEVSGDELARQLRAMQPDLPVLYVTGFSDQLFAERHLLWEGEAFLDKPFSPKGLLEALTQVRATVSAAPPVAY